MSRIELLIIDEIGYLELSKRHHHYFLDLISKRYEKASTIVTSNKEFQEWGQIFGDDVIATAILDRLLHHSHPFLINGPSWRMKDLMSKIKK
jgi:DNA replication protein DnaC